MTYDRSLRKKRMVLSGACVEKQAAVVLQEVGACQRLLDIAASVSAKEGIRQGLDDAKKGNVRPARAFFKEFEAARGPSPKNLASRKQQRSYPVADSAVLRIERSGPIFCTTRFRQSISRPCRSLFA